MSGESSSDLQNNEVIKDPCVNNIESVNEDDISLIKKHSNSELGVELDEEKDQENCIEAVESPKNHACSCSQYLDKIKFLEEKCFNLSNVNVELDTKLKLLNQKCESINKEKEAMIVRYAVNEKAVIDQKSLTEKVEKKLKEVIRENEILQHKVSMMCTEKTRICHILDNKCHELKTSQQELENTKSDYNTLETKLKWCQNNLKNQIELNKEKDENIENLNKKLQDVTSQIEKAKSDAEEYIKNFRYSQNNEAYVLGKQVQELQAQLILLKHEKTEKETQIANFLSEMEKMKNKESEIVNENNDLSLKLEDIQKQFAKIEEEYISLKDCREQKKQVSEELTAKNAEIEQLKCILKIKDDQIEDLNVQLSSFKQRNIDLELDIKSCKEREAEMLIFTKQLTDKNVSLQSDFTALEAKVQQLLNEQPILKRSAEENELLVKKMSNQLSHERKKYSDEISVLKIDLEKEIEKNELLDQQVSDLQGENLVLKRKLELSLRELNKELQQCRKKLEQSENCSNCTSSSSSTISVGDGTYNSSDSPIDQVQVIQPEMVIEKQTLLDHIVKLQRISAKKSEKIDFLEEHVNTLVEELQKKTRLLQSYMINDHSGALSSNSMDNNKAKIAKSHGVMASMYSSRVVDNNLTLELCLDINRKLQAVLEDALLKNMTLKENVDTLGAEIDRLNKLLCQT